MELLKWIGGIVVAAALLVVIAFAVPALRLQVMQVYGTNLESAKTDIYRENKSYIEGTLRDLRELRVDYIRADESHREALASLILHRANELDWERLPIDLRQFLSELRGEQ